MEKALDLTSIKVGRKWFQWRGFSPSPLLILILFLPANFVPTGILFVLPILGIVLAEWIRVWAVGYAGSATRTRGDKVPQLIHAGPFRWVRNPLYVANILLYTSVSVLFGYSWLSLFAFLYFVIQYHFIVQYEESLLRDQFGEPYLKYCESVNRWLPDRFPYPTSGHPFELRKAIRSERSSLIAILLIAIFYWLLRVL